LRLGFLLIKVV